MWEVFTCSDPLSSATAAPFNGKMGWPSLAILEISFVFLLSVIEELLLTAGLLLEWEEFMLAPSNLSLEEGAGEGSLTADKDGLPSRPSKLLILSIYIERICLIIFELWMAYITKHLWPLVGNVVKSLLNQRVLPNFVFGHHKKSRNYLADSEKSYEVMIWKILYSI